MKCDAGSVLECLAKLGSLLERAKVLNPARDAMQKSLQASLLAVQLLVGAWALIQSEAKQSGILSGDDGARKFRALHPIGQKEIIVTTCAVFGNNGIADFSCVEQILCNDINL